MITWEELLALQTEGTMFYSETQNNSGGYYLKNDDVSEVVIVEASTPEEAESIFCKAIEGYDEFCSCCGQRWWYSFDESDGDLVPSVHGKSLDTRVGDSWWSESILYMKNGRKFKINTYDENGVIIEELTV